MNTPTQPTVTFPGVAAFFDHIEAKTGHRVETVEVLRRRVNDLAQVLVHDCDRCERCYCFGQGDVDAYEAAKAALAAREGSAR